MHRLSVARSVFVALMVMVFVVGLGGMRAAPASAATLAQCTDLFVRLDQDGSGNISAPELRAALGRFGSRLTDAQLQAIVAKADADGDGQIDFSEFQAGLAQLGVHCTA